MTTPRKPKPRKGGPDRTATERSRRRDERTARRVLLRLDADHAAALESLQARWSTTAQDAVCRAIRDASAPPRPR
jgi:hypothetical protein